MQFFIYKLTPACGSSRTRIRLRCEESFCRCRSPWPCLANRVATPWAHLRRSRTGRFAWPRDAWHTHEQRRRLRRQWSRHAPGWGGCSMAGMRSFLGRSARPVQCTECDRQERARFQTSCWIFSWELFFRYVVQNFISTLELLRLHLTVTTETNCLMCKQDQKTL